MGSSRSIIYALVLPPSLPEPRGQIRFYFDVTNLLLFNVSTENGHYNRKQIFPCRDTIINSTFFVIDRREISLNPNTWAGFKIINKYKLTILYDTLGVWRFAISQNNNAEENW